MNPMKYDKQTVTVVPTDIDIKTAQQAVIKIQGKIVEAYKAKDMNKVKKIQRLLANSHTARLLAVHSVVTSKGAKTAGVDDFVIISSEQFIEEVDHLLKVVNKPTSYKPLPVRRVYIPKGVGSTEIRPLGIPTVRDRCVQTLYRITVEAVIESQSDEHSYGFREGLSSIDAVSAIKEALLTLPQPMKILDADIQKFFDSVDHTWLLAKVPMDTVVLNAILKAGVIEDSNILPNSDKGFPQGGPISSVLGNAALNGIEPAIKKCIAKYEKLASTVRVIRYADDLIVTGPNADWAIDRIKEAITKFLGERGLKLHPIKTKVVNRSDGFDSLGYNYQWVHKNDGPNKWWLRITPSDKAIEGFRVKVKELADSINSVKQRGHFIDRLNSLINGWAQYHKYGNPTIAFANLDNYVWHTYRNWLYHFYPEANDEEFRKIAFKKVGNFESAPYYYDDNNDTVVLSRLSNHKAVWGHMPRKK